MRLLPVIMALAILLLGLDWGRTASAEAVAQGDAGTTITANASLLGDANCSGSVDAVDALEVLRSVAGLPVSGGCLPAADTDCSGLIDAVDALRIERFVAGLSLAYPSGCGPVGPPQLSSEELIDKALADGKIDAETALTYKVFAAFGDSRLPGEYKGNDSGARDSDAILRAAISYSSLSPETQSTLAPFLLSPSAPGSWLDLPTMSQNTLIAQTAEQPAALTWKTYPAVDAPVKFWAEDRYPGDDAKAQALADAMTNKIWPSIIGLMGADHAPLSDVGLANNGGDGALDIYLVHFHDHVPYGLTLPADPEKACELFPTYVLINSDNQPLGSETSPGLLQTVAHEFFHAVQSTFHLSTNCWWPEYGWATEGMATWVEDYVYPLAQSEQPYAHLEMDEPWVSLDSLLGSHRYGTYLMGLYMARQLENPGLVKSLWQNFATNTSLAALDKVLPGGLQKTWPDFALQDWNRPPVDNFKQADNLQVGANPSEDETLSDGGIGIHTTVNYLGATYYHFKFTDEARAVTFENWSLPANATISALVNIGGQWQNPQDWTSDKKKSFCRDNPSQDIQEMVLVISNTDWQGKKPVNLDGPTVQAYTTGCKAWEGWIDAKYRYDDVTYSTHLDYVRFEVRPETEGNPTPWYDWKHSSSMLWTVSGSLGGCVTSGQLTIKGPAQDDTQNWSLGHLEINRTNHTYDGRATGNVNGATFTLTCQSSTSQQVWPGMLIWNTGQTQLPMSQDGNVIEGEYTDPKAEWGGTWNWHLTPAP